jgi:hypothetical protein
MTTTFSPRVSKLTITPVDRQSLLNAIIRYEKSDGQILNQCTLSLKDTCTRRLLLLLGDNHEVYQMYLSPQLIRYINYDYLTTTKNNEYRSIADNLKLLFCRDCSINDLGASKCHRRKCLANRLRQVLDKLSCQIIPWEKQKRFAILENNDANDDEEEEDNSIAFIYLKSINSRDKKRRDQKWIEEQFYLFDLLRILRINMVRE